MLTTTEELEHRNLAVVDRDVLIVVLELRFIGQSMSDAQAREAARHAADIMIQRGMDRLKMLLWPPE